MWLRSSAGISRYACPARENKTPPTHAPAITASLPCCLTQFDCKHHCCIQSSGFACFQRATELPQETSAPVKARICSHPARFVSAFHRISVLLAFRYFSFFQMYLGLTIVSVKDSRATFLSSTSVRTPQAQDFSFPTGAEACSSNCIQRTSTESSESRTVPGGYMSVCI